MPSQENKRMYLRKLGVCVLPDLKTRPGVNKVKLTQKFLSVRPSFELCRSWGESIAQKKSPGTKKGSNAFLPGGGTCIMGATHLTLKFQAMCCWILALYKICIRGGTLFDSDVWIIASPLLSARWEVIAPNANWDPWGIVGLSSRLDLIGRKI